MATTTCWMARVAPVNDTMETAMMPTVERIVHAVVDPGGGDGVVDCGRDVGAQRGWPRSGIARRYSFGPISSAPAVGQPRLHSKVGDGGHGVGRHRGEGEALDRS